ncbi:enoyl-CoA hydratase/isomerase family protein [Mycobacterium sp. NPDC003449]
MNFTGTTADDVAGGLVRHSVVDEVAVITLNRPDAMNALTPALVSQLEEVWKRAVAEPVRAAVLTGAGRGFCAGADLKCTAALLGAGRNDVMGDFLATSFRIVELIRDAPVITVAAVNGAAAGAGMGYALATDFRVLSRSAALHPRFAGLGVAPDNGSSYFLSHFLGSAHAARFLLRDQPMNAGTAFEFGIADQVVDDGESVVAAAVDLARSINPVPSSSLQGIRQLSVTALAQSLSAQLAEEERLARAMWPTFREKAAEFGA